MGRKRKRKKESGIINRRGMQTGNERKNMQESNNTRINNKSKIKGKRKKERQKLTTMREEINE